jgi:hypothetical protein
MAGEVAVQHEAARAGLIDDLQAPAMLSFWPSNPTNRVVDLPMARLLDKLPAATADRLVEASLLKLSSHLVQAAQRKSAPALSDVNPKEIPHAATQAT